MKAIVVYLWPWICVGLLAAGVSALAGLARRKIATPPCFGDYPNGPCNECKPEIKVSCIGDTK